LKRYDREVNNLGNVDESTFYRNGDDHPSKRKERPSRSTLKNGFHHPNGNSCLSRATA
jgi:hypothetical protein